MFSEKKIEILAPAGSVEGMKAAFHAGADAVYMGGSRFGARAYADNPEEEDLKRAIDYAHIHNKKLYLTLNTLLKDSELEGEVHRFLSPYYREGLDGVLIQDFGLLSLLKESFPKLPVHASTQMTITGIEMAKWLEQQGMERIVLSRELSLEEIKTIRQNTRMELEVFVQGALCYCYSGQCLMSSVIGGRSGNRGRCAQPCRLPYQAEGDREGRYLLSPKDICTLSDIPDLVESGTDSFKIEGRMKKPEYAALTAFLYRHYTDLYLEYGQDRFCVDEKDMERLMDLYNRGGFSGGYLHRNNGAEMIFTERPNHMGVPAGTVTKKGDIRACTELKPGDVLEIRSKTGKEELQWTLGQPVPENGLFKPETGKKKEKNRKLIPGTTVFRMRNPSLIEKLHERYLRQELKEKIYGTLRVMKDFPVTLTLIWGDISVSLEGAEAEPAKNQPMSAGQLGKPIQQTGGTPFVFEELEVETDGQCYVPNQQLKLLRRRGLEALEAECLKKYMRNEEEKAPPQEQPVPAAQRIPALHVMLTGPQMLRRGCLLAEFRDIRRVYVELHEAVQEDFQTVRLLKREGKEIYFALPGIVREKDRQKLISYIKSASEFADGWLVRHMEAFLMVKSLLPEGNFVFDSSIYSMNRRSKTFLSGLGNVELTAPAELNYPELKKLGCSDMELVIYGHQQLMISAQCVKKTREGCTKRPEMLQLTDRQHKHFYVYNECEFCYNKIYNGLPTMLIDKKKELLELAPASVRVHFIMETEEEMRALLSSYKSIYRDGLPAKNILKDFTRGHFARGIE